jgi:hypothetical protein
LKEVKNLISKVSSHNKMTKVGEHITLDIIGTTKEYDPSVFEKVIMILQKLQKLQFLIFQNISLNHKVLLF